MLPKPRLVIAGGSGVFGRLFAMDVARSGAFQLVIAGRNVQAASSFVRELGEDAEAKELDLRDSRELRRVASGAFAVVCLAGPFQGFDSGAPSAVIDAGAHWLDISDDPGWVDPLLTDEALRRRCIDSGMTVIPGLSSTPALSGVLVRRALEELGSLDHVSITLFIGNRNVKGAGAIASAISGGTHQHDAAGTIDLPFGRKRALTFSSPDEILLRRELGISSTFSVAFELPAADWLVRVGRAVPMRRSSRERMAGLLSILAKPFSRFGSDSGGLDVLGRSPKGKSCRLRLIGYGQRMAILPALFALQELRRGALAPGCTTPATILPLEGWFAKLDAEGVRLVHPPV